LPVRPLRLLLLLIGLAAAPARAQPAAAVSPGPDSVSVTVYRDPNRGAEDRFNLAWLNGYALVTEHRTIDIPAGEADIRFEGVAGGIIPESAIVTGLPDGVIEKNRDAWLLSPASLLDASLGRRVHIRRTSRATGAVTESEAVIRSGAGGAVVLETPAGTEAFRCTGLPETLIYDHVPEGLSAKPTLAVRTRSARAARATVTLSYLATGFDWQADYVAELSSDGTRMDLFAWLTLANGDETSFVRADTQAVAGKLNREPVDVSRPQAPPLQLQCWPQGNTTSDLAEYKFGRVPLPPPMEMSDIVVSGSRVTNQAMMASTPVAVVTAEQEELGDLKLYRIPEPVTVASNSQKQVALLRHEAVPVAVVYRYVAAGPETQGATPTIVTRNRQQERLGVPLPAGGIAFFERHEGRRVLVGRGHVRDLAVGEDVELESANSIDVNAEVVLVSEAGGIQNYRLTVSNAKPYPVKFEAALHKFDGTLSAPGVRLGERDGYPLWRVTVPANGTAELRYEVARPK
jgi:hypothetical protein